MKRSTSLDHRILRILIPAILENALLLLSSMILTGYIGRLSINEISSYGIANRIYSIYFSISQGFSIGTMALLARKFGKNDVRACSRLQMGCYLLLLPLAAVAMILIFLFSRQLLSTMTEETVLLDQAQKFLMQTIWFYPLISIVHQNATAFQADGNTKTPLEIATIGNIVNLILGYMLIFGKGAPRLGLSGAAWSQNISFLVMASTGLYFLYGKNGLFSSQKIESRLSLNECREIVKTGTPASIENSLWNIAAVDMSCVILSYGRTEYAAYQLGMQGEAFCDMMSAGFLTAAMSLSANAIGASDSNLYQNALNRLNYYCRLISGVTMLFLLLFSPFVLRLLTDKAELIQIAKIYCYMMIISQYPQHHQKILYGYLRSAGYYNSPLVISLIGIYGCRVLLSYIFGFLLHWNIVWIWIAMDVDQWARDIFAAIIFKVRNVKSYVKEQTNAAKC